MLAGQNVAELHRAAERGDAAQVRRLLAAAADPAALVAAADRAHSMNAVHHAVRNSAHNLELLRLLLQANPSAATARTTAGGTPLHQAVWSRTGCVGAVRLLLEAAPSSAAAHNDEGLTPFEVLCMSGQYTRWDEGRCCAARLLMAGVR